MLLLEIAIGLVLARVSWLDEQTLVMIADEVLGGCVLLKEWRQELVAANV